MSTFSDFILKQEYDCLITAGDGVLFQFTSNEDVKKKRGDGLRAEAI
jgi:hypothetical protein